MEKIVRGPEDPPEITAERPRFTDTQKIAHYRELAAVYSEIDNGSSDLAGPEGALGSFGLAASAFRLRAANLELRQENARLASAAADVPAPATRNLVIPSGERSTATERMPEQQLAEHVLRTAIDEIGERGTPKISLIRSGISRVYEVRFGDKPFIVHAAANEGAYHAIKRTGWIAENGPSGLSEVMVLPQSVQLLNPDSGAAYTITEPQQVLTVRQFDPFQHGQLLRKLHDLQWTPQFSPNPVAFEHGGLPPADADIAAFVRELNVEIQQAPYVPQSTKDAYGRLTAGLSTNLGVFATSSSATDRIAVIHGDASPENVVNSLRSGMRPEHRLIDPGALGLGSIEVDFAPLAYCVLCRGWDPRAYEWLRQGYGVDDAPTLKEIEPRVRLHMAERLGKRTLQQASPHDQEQAGMLVRTLVSDTSDYYTVRGVLPNNWWLRLSDFEQTDAWRSTFTVDLGGPRQVLQIAGGRHGSIWRAHYVGNGRVVQAAERVARVDRRS